MDLTTSVHPSTKYPESMSAVNVDSLAWICGTLKHVLTNFNHLSANAQNIKKKKKEKRKIDTQTKP